MNVTTQSISAWARKGLPAGTFIIIVLTGLFFVFAGLIHILFGASEQQFMYLAMSFLHGSFSFPAMPTEFTDTVFFGGKYYSPFAPFPAIALMPFVFVFQLFGTLFYQGYPQLFLTAGIFYCAFLLARKHAYSVSDALWLAFAFCFASVYQIVALLPWSWFFAHAITVFLLFCALVEFFGKRRYWLIGILLAAVYMSRFTAGLEIFFFVTAVVCERGISLRKKIIGVCSLAVPICVAGILLLGYNVARFGTLFDNGYVLTNAWLLPEAERYELIHRGLFQLRNIPTNVYYYFLKTFDPVILHAASRATYLLEPPYVTVHLPGTSFFVVSPIFLFAFRARWREKIVKYTLAPMVLILFILLTYYWPGWRQVGPRYLLDLLPLAYVVLLYSFPGQRLSRIAKGVVVVSAFANVYFFILVMGQ